MDMFGRDSSGGQSSGELRLILVGNIGCGKTLTADTLLNDSSSLSALMPSRLSEVRRGLSEGRHLRVVETPRWYWKGEHIDVGVQKETEKALSLVAPGPHAFLILVPVGQFTEMETRIPAELERAFGRGALEHALVLLTCGDYLAGRDHDRYISVGEPGLSTMVNDCGGRWHVINNRRPEDRKQVISLLEKVERLTKVSGGCYLPSPMQRQVEEGIHEKERELIRSYSLREEELVSPEHSALSHTAWSKEETWDDSGRRKIRVRSMGPATGRVMSQQLANGLHSQTSYDDTELKQKSSSFKLSKEGAILSQMSETEQAAKNQTNQNFINTIHYHISTLGDTSSAATSIPSPTASSLAPSASTYFSSYSSSTLPSSPIKALSPSSTNATFSSSPTNFSYSSSTLPSSPIKALSSSSTNATLSSSPTNFSYSSSTLPSSPIKALSSSSTNATFSSSPTNFSYSSSTLPSSPTKAMSSSLSTGISSSPTKATFTSSSSSAFSSFSPYTHSPFSPSNALSTSSSTHIASTPTISSSSSLSSSGAFTSVSPNTKALVFPSTSEVSSSFPSINASFLSSSNTISASSASSTYASSTALSSHSSTASSFFSNDSSDELRLVLLGRTGSGKSAAGNAILGQHKFKLRRDDATGATTQSCVNGTAMVGKKRVTVVDTPDWFWPPENMETHLSSCIDLCAPGPHAFLLCVPVTLPGRSNLHDLSSLKSSFGPDDIQRRTLVLFTHSDKLKDGNVEDYIAAKRPELLELVEKCEDRFHVLKQGRNERNIEELLEKVEQAVKESGGSHYSCQGQGEVGRERMTQLRRGRGGEDAVDRANSATLHSLREEEEVEQEEKNTNTWKTTASSVASVLGTVLKFVGQKVGQGAQQVPKPVAGGAVLGGVLGMYFGGPIGGAVGVTAGSAAAEYGRRKYSKPKTD